MSIGGLEFLVWFPLVAGWVVLLGRFDAGNHHRTFALLLHTRFIDS